MRRVLVGTVVAVFLLAFVSPLVAQQGTSEIAGRVTDEQGAVLPGATIVITNEATGVFREVVSGAEGTYFVSQLIPGRYKISAKLTGFRPMERAGLVLQVGNTLTINLSLAVGGIEETVQVTAQSPLVDTTSARVGGNLGTADLSELPAMNRNYFATVGLLPGVQFTPSNQMGNDTIIAGGQTSQNTNVSVDGGYNADDALGTSAGAQVRTPLEAVQEFQVLTSMYDAEYGRASGAIVNAVSKAGTNQFKGVAFGYAASNKLTAKDALVTLSNQAKPTTTQREWGGVLGGPIVRNKAHFFVSLERQVDNPNRTGVFTSQPSLNFAIAEDRTDWNTLIRFDHQIEYMGRTLAAGVGPAVAHDGRQADARLLPGRNRPRSDRGRHADERVRQCARQHGARGENMGALVARQPMLPRSDRPVRHEPGLHVWGRGVW